MVIRRLLAPVLLFLLFGCASPTVRVRQEAGFSPRPDKQVLFVVPFTTVMVPPEVEENVFDRFVDALNEGGQSLRYDFVILKEELAAVDRQWLARQNYVTGEVFGYVEESGCCATAIRVRSRVRLHQPGSDLPTLEMAYPREVFFDHDYSSLEAERRKLAADIAAALAGRLLAALSGP